MGVFEEYSFWVIQGLCLIGTVLMVLRMQQSDRRQFDLYHTYMCMPMLLVWSMQGAWVMFGLTFVGALRTLMLAQSWGWRRRSLVVGSCLFIAVAAGIYNAKTGLDWFLLVATVWAVGSEAFKNFLNLRAATMVGCLAWALNSVVYGAYVNALANLFAMASNLHATERDFKLFLRLRAALGCEKSRAAYLAQVV